MLHKAEPRIRLKASAYNPSKPLLAELLVNKIGENNDSMALSYLIIGVVRSASRALKTVKSANEASYYVIII